MKMLFPFKTFLFFFISLTLLTSLNAQNMEAALDEVITAVYTPDDPGISILVAKDGKAIYRKAFGKASLELGVTLTPDNVFELGSITKQFTAVAILMLEEQGKLKIKDEITKYIPGYPTKGKTITIHHLLNHTSGIKSYTGMQSFMKNARMDMTPTELIDVFKNETMDFDPGEKMLYNNSGYILLGYIIEVVSKQTYEDFIEQHIFEKLGMASSYYGSMKQLIKNRALGYQQNDKGYTNAEYLSLTLPYAAGSLMSNVDDMLKWQNAISDNTLIKRSSLEKAINGSVLNSGEKINYGYGWSKGNINGTPGIAHGGGIFGYSTNGIFLPSENVYVIALSNCNCKNVNEVSSKVAAIAIGRPYPNKDDAVSLSESQLKRWVGAYQFDKDIIRHIILEDGQLVSLREGSEKFKIYPMSESHFIFESGMSSYMFKTMSDGKKQAIYKAQDEMVGKEIDKAPPADKVALKVPAEILEQFTGKYQLQPNFIITISVEGDKIYAQATGQGQNEIFAEAKDKFFFKVVAAQLVFSRDEQGKVNMITLYQGGQKMPGKKLN